MSVSAKFNNQTNDDLLTTLSSVQSSNDPSLWQDVTNYEYNGFNVFFISMVILVISCSICAVLMNHCHRRRKTILVAEEQRKKCKRRSTWMSTQEIAFGVEDQMAIRIEQMDTEYRDMLQLPYYYYIIKFLRYFSILIEYVIALFYISNGYNEIYAFYVMWSFAMLMSCCSVYGFCITIMELSQTLTLLFLCDFTPFALIIFISIFIFQVTAHCIEGMMNGGDICDFAECQRDKTQIESNQITQYIFENIKIALFGNFEALPLLYFGSNSPFRNIWYELSLVLMIWISVLSPDYIKYLAQFGEYFRPKKHWNHYFLAFYQRMQIVFGVSFRIFNFLLCSYYFSYFMDSMDTFEFFYCIAMISVNAVFITCFPVLLCCNKDQCGCGGLEGCCCWFWCCAHVQ